MGLYFHPWKEMVILRYQKAVIAKSVRVLVSQATSLVSSAPLPKGGWHGEAVTGGFLTSPHLL